MKYSVIFADTAKQDLREIAFYIADKAKNIVPAKALIMELRSKCNILESFPEAGAYPKDRILRSVGYRYLIHKDYLIFYSIDSVVGHVYIKAIFHSKKDYMRVMRKFI